MKKIPFKKKHLIAFFALCAPIILVSGRDVVLRELSEYFHVTKLAPSMVSKPSCENDICSTSTSFDLNQEIIKKYKNTTVGTYGAEIDSYLNVFGEDIEPIKTKNEIRPTWMKFRTWSIDTKNASSGTVKLICISPMGTKKLGLASNALYIGSKNDLEIIQFVHSLYNIHSYFLLALAILFVGFFIFFSATIVDSISTSELIKKTLVLSFASILFSTILDDLFVGIGIPFPVIPNLPQLLWGPVLLLSVFDPGNKRKFFITLWIIRIICSSASWKYQEFFLYNTYRWAVLTVIVVSAIEVFKNPKKRFVTPYLIFAFWDYLCLINFVAVRSAVYLSPLGFFGLFISEHIGYLSAILDHHIYWYERRVLSKRLQELRDAKSIDKEEWLALQIEVCKSLRNATGASRIGWVYLGFDSPIVLSVEGETVKKYEDGQLPPVFARVIQTKQSLWWVTDKELASFFPGHISRPSTNYKTNRAVVLPILVGADSYGAVALTEFENIQEIMNSDDKRQQLEQIITSFVDLISVQLVKKKESSSSLLQKQANELIRAFSEGVASLGKRNEIIEMFLKLVAKNSPCSAMYFDFEPKTERLHLITAVNMEDEQFKQWSDIPFRARPTNRISPFAITINEKRSVFIDNIQSFFNFLTPQSIEVLSVSGTKGFICSPVIFADQVIGLVCLLDIPGEDPLKSHVISIVELAIKYFAYQLNQLEVAGLVRAQEGVLRQFADKTFDGFCGIKGDSCW